ncbi:hypothetical protein GGR57DRAFT_162628 [Xylariaceae sp. FL1272]|nr:hypothetical protein GGR57DRAFT_162628 [Xylariaceae sp. FL1272]
MASNSYFTNKPYNRYSQHSLNHKVSNLSDSSDSPAPLHGRESLVSLQSFYEPSPPAPSSSTESVPEPRDYERGTWAVSFRGNERGGQYQPVTPPTPPTSNFGRFRSFRDRSRAHETIYEDESIDMSLLSSAMPPARSGSYNAVPADEPAEPAFDMTSFSSPVGMHDQEFLKSLQAQEAKGKLTGGLGQGEGPSRIVFTGEQLLANSPTLKRSLTRSFSRLAASHSYSRPAWNDLGQEEANKRGEVIEVVMDEPTDVDLSTMVGPNTVGMDQVAKPTPITQTFYPQPNWKPFTMRWPYLLFLIILSIALGIAQELIYQKSDREQGLIKFENAKQLSPGYYFIFKFVPTIATVSFGILWQSTDFEVKRLEAYYQMSKRGGALATESLNVDYITMFSFAVPFVAMAHRHDAVAISSIATLLAVSLVPTLGSAALVLQSAPDESTSIITVNAILSRVLTAIFFVISIYGAFLYYQLATRRSGLLADVKGIAGIAAMAVVSHIMVDFQDMDVAKPKDIHHKLKSRRYELRNNSLFSDSAPVNARARDDNVHLPENPHPLMLRKEAAIPFIIFIILFLGFIPAFLFTPAKIVADRAPWVVTALAVIIKLCWGSLETSIRMMEPYYILSKRHAPPKTLVLDYTALPFVAVAIRAFFNRHWIVFIVGLGTILVEGLTIFATSLTQVDGLAFLNIVTQSGKVANVDLGVGAETVRSFTVTLALTVFILLYLFIVATVVFVRRRHPFLPRQPNTIASVLAFMHQSKMLYDFVGTAKLNSMQMREKLDKLGKTYGLGWFNGRDGQTHCGVDQEELNNNYKHGVDYSRGNNPWLTEWQTF